MTRTLPRRSLLLSLAALPAVVALAACNDESNAATQAPATPATPPSGNQATPAAAEAAPQSDGSVDMAQLLQPGALPDEVMGKADAPVTIVEYASMTCPHCAHFHATTLPDLKKKYIDTGKVRLIFREFPFDPRAEAGFMLARCSDDRYFPMVDVLFSQQQVWAVADNAREALLQIAKLAGFTQQRFESCLTDQKLLENIRAVRDRATKDFKVDSTPTFFINGKVYKGAMTIGQMSAIIDPLLG